MAKISRPIVYIALLGAVAYAGVVLTEPDKPATKVVKRTTITAQAPKGFASEDLNAKFPRYTGRQKDAFLPRVVSASRTTSETPKVPAPSGKIPGMANGVWMLTGITSVNGVRSALLENGAAGDSVFLKAGDIWNGMRVAAVEPSAVVMVSPTGQKTRFGFPMFDETPAGGAPTAPLGVPGVPGGAPGTLGVAPVVLPTPPGFRGRRGIAPLMAEPIPAGNRSSNRDNQSNLTNRAPEMLSSASETGQRNPNE